MPGNEPKAHHFVQQKYLEAFCDLVPHEKTGASVLWIHTAHQAPRRQVPKECAVENYFYCHEDENGKRSFLGEKFLADLESASADVVRSAQKGILPANLRDRYTLTGYVAMSLVRTPKARSLIDRAAVDHFTEWLQELINDPTRHAEACAEIERETGECMDPAESRRALTGGKMRAAQSVGLGL